MAIQHDLHRDTLHDLGEVAGRVVRRQQGEFEAAGWRNAVHAAVDPGTRQAVHVDADRLAGAHVDQLCLLVVCHHIGRVQRDHSHELGTCRYILADAQRPSADCAVHGRHDGGVTEIQLGLALGRLGALHLGRGFVTRRLQHLDFALRRGEPSYITLQLGSQRIARGLCLLGALHRSGASAGEIAVADCIVPREVE